MDTLRYCAKQAAAMSDYATDRAKARLDSAIDSEESRDEQIANYARELTEKRLKAMAPIDVVCGMQSVLEGGTARLISERLLTNELRTVGLFVRTLVESYIESDSEVMAQEWMLRMDAEVARWGSK